MNERRVIHCLACLYKFCFAASLFIFEPLPKNVIIRRECLGVERDGKMSTTRTVAKVAGLLMVANLLSRCLGFLRESLLAGFFGQSAATDAWNTAFILPDLLYWLLVGGALSAAFIPVLSGYIARGEKEEGWRVVSSVVNIILVVLCLLIIGALIFTPQYIYMQVPGFDPARAKMTVHLTRILLLQPLLMAMSGFAMGVLNSYKVFWPSALGTLLYTVCVIVFGTILTPWIGISAFAVGTVVGAAVNFAVQIPALRRVGWHHYAIMDWRHPGVRKIIALAIPMIIAMAMNQIQVVVNSNIGSALVAGSLSSVWWSYRLFQVPVGVFALAIGVAVFPTLTEYAALKRWDNFRETASHAVRMVIYITLPISAGMIALRYPLIQVLFEHGHFSGKDTIFTAIPLLYFSLGITAQSVIQILPRMFYAMQDTWTPVILGIISMGVNILAMIVLVGPLAHGGLALATTVGAFANMALLLVFLKRKMGRMDGKKMVWTAVQAIAASCLMGSVVWIWNLGLTYWLGTGGVSAIIRLFTGMAIGVLVYLGVTKFMRMEEVEDSLAMVKRKLGR